jgi:hypothetical protein
VQSACCNAYSGRRGIPVAARTRNWKACSSPTVADRSHSRNKSCSIAPRSRRILLILMGVVILSLADLAITLAYLRANWMMEANPIAAYLIKTTQSAWLLAWYKIITVAVCVALLYRVRHSRAGEVAAWCALAILCIMSIMWRSYSNHLDDPQIIVLAHATHFDDGRLGMP